MEDKPALKIEGLMDGAPKSVEPVLKIKTEALAHRGQILKLLQEIDPALRKPSEPFDFANPKLDPVTLTQSLIKSMRAYGGVGLSAIQVGYPLRVFVVGYQNQNQVFFNPEIVALSTSMEKKKEGCVSFPFCYVLVNRPTHIRVRYQDETGIVKEDDFSGYTARIIQHEYDHLEGIVLPDKISKLGWKLIKDKAEGLYKKALRMEKQKHAVNL